MTACLKQQSILQMYLLSRGVCPKGLSVLKRHVGAPVLSLQKAPIFQVCLLSRGVHSGGLSVLEICPSYNGACLLKASIFQMCLLSGGVHSKGLYVLQRCVSYKGSYYIDKSVLVENKPLVKFIRNHIWDSSGIFSISSLVRILMTSFPAFILLFAGKYSSI